jgi:hypothetical protein
LCDRVRAGRELERHAGAGRRGLESLRHDALRLLEGVERLQIRSRQGLAREDAGWRHLAPLERELSLGIQVTIQDQQRRLALLGVQRRDNVDEGDLVVASELGLQSSGGDWIGVGRSRTRPRA